MERVTHTAAVHILLYADVVSWIVEGHIPPQHLCFAVQRHYRGIVDGRSKSLSFSRVAHEWAMRDKDGDIYLICDSRSELFDVPITSVSVRDDFKEHDFDEMIKPTKNGELETLEWQEMVQE